MFKSFLGKPQSTTEEMKDGYHCKAACIPGSEDIATRTSLLTSLSRFDVIPVKFPGFPSSSGVKNLPAMQEVQVKSLVWEDPLEEGMATHPSILAWRVPWTEEPDGLQFIRSQRVGHN